MPTISPSVLPVLMLFASNVFMTFAWYGHLKYRESWLPVAVLVSWGIVGATRCIQRRSSRPCRR